MTQPRTLTGSQIGVGVSTDYTGTDIFNVTGLYNEIISGAGNLTVSGYVTLPPLSTSDSRTTILMNANVGKVTDSINLNGRNNVILMNGAAQLTGGSTISVLVSHLAIPPTEADGGNNYVNLANAVGVTSVELSGPANTVVLNGNANNTVTMDGGALFALGGSTIIIGGPVTEANPQGPIDDDLFYKASTDGGPAQNVATVKLSDSFNTVIGGDEQFTVTGGASFNGVALGDGNNAITLTGSHNSIDVGGGFNTIYAGTTNNTVLIQGADHANQLPVAGNIDGLPSNPKDKVYLNGGGNKVFANYEDVLVDQLNPNSAGGDLLVLGNSTLYGSTDQVQEFGDNNTIVVGAGVNTIATEGNNQTIIIQDTRGVGSDTVTLDSGNNNIVSFDHAGGSVGAVGLTAGGVITLNVVVQAQDATNQVIVNLETGRGEISLGNGNDQVTLGGSVSEVALGNGNNTVNASGNNTVIVIGSGPGTAGNNTVVANGNNDQIFIRDGSKATEMVTANGNNTLVLLGNGTDTVTANGAGAVVVVGNGNDTVTANGASAFVQVGSGNDKVSATGVGSHITVNAASTSTDQITLGSGDFLRVNGGGTQAITGGSNDVIWLNSTNVNSVTTLNGSGNHVFLGSNGSDEINLDPSQTNNVITLQSLTAAGTYTGTMEIVGFGPNSTIDLEHLVGGNGAALNTFANVFSNITQVGTSYNLALSGGGVVKLDTSVPFQASEFAFSNNFGPV